MQAILSIDQGSSGTKAIVLGPEREVLSRSSSPLGSSSARLGWVDFSAEEMWASVVEAVGSCLASLPRGTEIAGVGIANQRESAIAWDRATLAPAGPAISWQCRRGEVYCELAEKMIGADSFRARTGLRLDTSLSAPKFSWLLANAQPASDVAVGTVESWLAARLTGAGHLAEVGNASRTGLLELERADWSPDLLAAFSLERDQLGAVVPSVGHFGTCSGLPGLEEADLTALCGDSHAALFSHAVSRPFALKATYGTGCSVLGLERPLSPEGSSCQGTEPAALNALARSIVWSFGQPVFGREGNVLSAGSSLEWMAAVLGVSSVGELEALARQANGDAVPVVVPALGGLGAPWHAPAALATVDGLSVRSGRSELALAAFEAVAHLVADLAALLVPAEGDRELLVDGGASRSDFLMQLQADLLGVPVVREPEQSRSALGAGYLAGLGAGLWTTRELATSDGSAKRFEPGISEEEREERRQRWLSTVAKCLGGERGR